MADKIKSANQQLNEMWKQKQAGPIIKHRIKCCEEYKNGFITMQEAVELLAHAIIPVNPYAGSNQNAR